jgi:LacI family transcriptional regulator
MAGRGASATILDVAGRAGVSAATASRVLSGSAHAVSVGTRRRVLAAARGLGYLPNMLARSLLTRETSAVGVLVPDVSNPYYAVILRGIEDAAGETGRAVILCNTDRRPDKLRSYLRTLLERRVDGLIVAGGAIRRADLAHLRGAPPVVVVGRHDVPFPSVRVDNVRAAMAATRHLIDLGHRRIACLAGPPASSTAVDRLAGYRRALLSSGLAVRPDDVVTAEFSLDGGRRGAERLYARDDPPTAVVAGSDQMAIGVLRALHERGLRVPDDVSVVGFDDSPLAACTIPALTSVAIPMYEIGRGAMGLLLRLLQGGRAASVAMPAELRVRETTAPPAAIRTRRRGPAGRVGPRAWTSA